MTDGQDGTRVCSRNWLLGVATFRITLGRAFLVGCLPALMLGCPVTGYAQQAPVPAQGQALASGQNGVGFPGATSSSGITTSQGENAKPATTEVSLPAGYWQVAPGITAQLNYVFESAGNVTGGIRQGAAYADQFLVGVDADLGKLAGIEGATIHVVGTNRDGRNLASDDIGNSLSVQEIYDGSEEDRLTVLTYEQKLFSDRVDFEVGRLPSQGAFLTSPLYCSFQNNATCGSPHIVYTSGGFIDFPAAVWGGHVKLFLTDKVFLHVGVFEEQPKVQGPGDHGLDFGLDGSTGVLVPVEVGYTTTDKNDAYPRNYAIGALIDQSTYADPVRDVAGGRALLTGLPAQQDFGRSLVYARFDQTVYRPDTTTPRGIALFGFFGGTGSGRTTTDFQLELGAVWTGPFATRPLDTLGLVVTDQQFSALALSNERAARVSIGLSPNGVPSNETIIELNYGVQVTPWLRIMPNVQVITGVDNLDEPYRRTFIADTLVLGAKVQVDFLTLAGLAKGP